MNAPDGGVLKNRRSGRLKVDEKVNVRTGQRILSGISTVCVSLETVTSCPGALVAPASTEMRLTLLRRSRGRNALERTTVDGFIRRIDFEEAASPLGRYFDP